MPSSPTPQDPRRGASRRRSDDASIAATRLWLERAVIGLNLCPFAKAEYLNNRIRYRVSHARTPRGLLRHLAAELRHLASVDPGRCETTLIIHPFVLQAFPDYNRFLNPAEATLRRLGLEGTLQIASFHPQYQFAGTGPDDITNFTNRSPHPMLHLLRESSIERAMRGQENSMQIIERNLATLRRLGHPGWDQLGLPG